MDLEDLFGGKRHHGRGHGGDRGHGDRHGGHGGHDEHDSHGSHGSDHRPDVRYVQVPGPDPRSSPVPGADARYVPAPGSDPRSPDPRYTSEHGDDRYRDDRYRYDRHSGGHPDMQRYLALLSANKGLFLVGGLLLVVLAVGLLVVALPLLGKALGAVDQNGVKGIVERLWLGGGGR
jgi:hypothetical protein